MNPGRPGSFVTNAACVIGMAIAWKFGRTAGALLYLPDDPLLQWSVGAVALLLLTVAIGNAIDRRTSANPGSSSVVALYLRGLLWRAAARLIWLGIFAAPAAAAYWIFTSGFLAGGLR